MSAEQPNSDHESHEKERLELTDNLEDGPEFYCCEECSQPEACIDFETCWIKAYCK